MNRNICVFCSSSDHLEPVFYKAAWELGTRIGSEGDGLVYGGTTVGLMGATARAARANGARVVGIIPERIHEAGIGWQEINEYIITSDMRERKALLSDKADVFMALPGGFGTMEEILEVMTAKQLGYHNKPIIFLNINAFYQPLLAHFETLYEQKIASPSFRKLYHVARDVEEAFSYLRTYRPQPFASKWERNPKK